MQAIHTNTHGSWKSYAAKNEWYCLLWILVEKRWASNHSQERKSCRWQAGSHSNYDIADKANELRNKFKAGIEASLIMMIVIIVRGGMEFVQNFYIKSMGYGVSDLSHSEENRNENLRLVEDSQVGYYFCNQSKMSHHWKLFDFNNYC